jgi:hypothetical protein
MPAIQTRPIHGDADFLQIQEAINRLLARYGFPLVTHKGSASWLAGAAYSRRSTETFFKLLYRGRGVPYVFGIRRDFAHSIDKLKALQWPLEFAVMPATEVPFVGFTVPPGGADVTRQRIEKILKTLPEPDPSLALPLDGEDDTDFDRQLENL